uniref:basic phospholipase A2 PA-12C-like n=1 Tax=Styela clava TaxID=7725 RepID=UPI00193A9D53|nr:basic phospholipase A2 PA-12C-like [Styela clava]
MNCDYKIVLFVVLCSVGVSRSTWHLGELIQCAQGKEIKTFWSTLWTLANYNDYGCYCGRGGSGTPVDASDRCCYNHDNCYDDVGYQYDLSEFTIYFATYSYKCNRGSIQCRNKRGWRRKLCECDKKLALCLSTHRDSYKTKHINLDIEKRC